MGDLVDLARFRRARIISASSRKRTASATSSARSRGRVQQGGAFQRFARQIRDAGLELGRKLVLPPAKGVGPRLDGVFVDRVFVNRADAPPTIVIDMSSWRSRASAFRRARAISASPRRRRVHP